MPRHARILIPGMPHHFTQRGNGGQPVFDTPADRALFLDLLARYSEQYRLSLWGYCLMDNHFHLIAVPLRDDSAARALGRLEADYARFLNVRRGTPGHLWQARFFSVPMAPAYSWRALAYVERNPVRAGMVDHAERFPWSSAASRLGLSTVPPWLCLNEWRRHWTPREWMSMLRDDAAEQTFHEQLRAATLSGDPLGGIAGRALL